jgi:hypothetical protein
MKTLVAALLFLAFPRWTGAAQVTLAASTPTATIGERIELRVVVRAEAGVEGIRVNVPAGDFDLVGRSRRPPVRTAEGSTFEEIIVIAFFRTGDFVVGPFQVDLLPKSRALASEQTGKLTLRIRSVLGENDKDIKPLKQLFVLRGDPRHLLKYAAALALLLLLGTLAWLGIRKMKKRKLPESEPLLAAEVELEMRAGKLRERNLPQKGEFRQFFIALSDILKHFIQRAYGFNALDCTTAETLAQLENLERDGEILSGLGTLLAEADLVKFARILPEKEALESIWPRIASLVATHKKRRETALAAAHVQTGS